MSPRCLCLILPVQTEHPGVCSPPVIGLQTPKVLRHFASLKCLFIFSPSYLCHLQPTALFCFWRWAGSLRSTGFLAQQGTGHAFAEDAQMSSSPPERSLTRLQRCEDIICQTVVTMTRPGHKLHCTWLSYGIMCWALPLQLFCWICTLKGKHN